MSAANLKATPAEKGVRELVQAIVPYCKSESNFKVPKIKNLIVLKIPVSKKRAKYQLIFHIISYHIHVFGTKR